MKEPTPVQEVRTGARLVGLVGTRAWAMEEGMSAFNPQFLECFNCPHPMFPSSHCDHSEGGGDDDCDGHLWWETGPTTCPKCGCVCMVMVEDGIAYVAEVEGWGDDMEVAP